jgi:hypothetical protein
VTIDGCAALASNGESSSALRRIATGAEHVITSYRAWPTEQRCAQSFEVVPLVEAGGSAPIPWQVRDP